VTSAIERTQARRRFLHQREPLIALGMNAPQAVRGLLSAETVIGVRLQPEPRQVYHLI
jgi:hypothetical protein